MYVLYMYVFIYACINVCMYERICIWYAFLRYTIMHSLSADVLTQERESAHGYSERCGPRYCGTYIQTYIHTYIAFYTAYIMLCNTIVFWLGRSGYEDSGNNNSGRHHRTNYWFDFYKAKRFSPEPFPILVVVSNK